jgi:hypothetical protein
MRREDQVTSTYQNGRADGNSGIRSRDQCRGDYCTEGLSCVLRCLPLHKGRDGIEFC